MNRADRRKAAKESRRHESAMRRMMRNGITQTDIDRKSEDAERKGFREGCGRTFQLFYAAAALALKRELGFGPKRSLRVLECVDQIVNDALSKGELLELAETDTGLEFDFDAPFARITIKER